MIGLCSVISACAVDNHNPDIIYLSDNNSLKEISVKDTMRNSDGFLKVSVVGETYSDTDLYYKVVWFDDEQMKINTLLSKSVKSPVRKNVPFYWTAVAPSKSAVSYKVYVADRFIEQ